MFAAVLACSLAACAHAALVPSARLPCARAATSRAPIAVSMVAPLDALPLDAAAFAFPTSLLLSDVFDGLQSFAASPAILLVPIGAGTLVAMAIIYVLVKSAG